MDRVCLGRIGAKRGVCSIISERGAGRPERQVASVDGWRSSALLAHGLQGIVLPLARQPSDRRRYWSRANVRLQQTSRGVSTAYARVAWTAQRLHDPRRQAASGEGSGAGEPRSPVARGGELVGRQKTGIVIDGPARRTISEL